MALTPSDYVRRWRLKYPEKDREYRRKYYLKNKDRIKQYCESRKSEISEYSKEHREKINKWRRANYSKNKYYFRTYARTYQKGQYYELRGKVLDKFGNKCKHCGFNDVRALQIDHINGGGRQEAKIYHGYYTYYKKILADEGANYQLLCANCNQIKVVENKEASGRPKVS